MTAPLWGINQPEVEGDVINQIIILLNTELIRYTVVNSQTSECFQNKRDPLKLFRSELTNRAIACVGFIFYLQIRVHFDREAWYMDYNEASITLFYF